MSLKFLKLESGASHNVQKIRILLERIVEEPVLFKPQTFSLVCS